MSFRFQTGLRTGGNGTEHRALEGKCSKNGDDASKNGVNDDYDGDNDDAPKNGGWEGVGGCGGEALVLIRTCCLGTPSSDPLSLRGESLVIYLSFVSARSDDALEGKTGKKSILRKYEKKSLY